MTMDVTEAVSGVLKKIKEAGPKGGLVSFDFTGGVPFVISSVIQRMLSEKGYIVMVAYSGRDVTPMTERMYIDLDRRRPKAVPKKAEESK